MKDDNLLEKSGGQKGNPIKKKHRVLKKALIIGASLVVVVTFAVVLPLSGIFGGKDDVAYPKAYAYNDYDTRMSIKNDNPVSDKTISCVNDFGYKTASEIIKGDKNANYSPISLYFALSLAQTGAGGETKTEMNKALGVSDDSTFSKECGNLYRNLYFDNNLGTMRIANSLWMNKSNSFNKDFIVNAKENFYASTHNVNLNSDGARREISNWIRNNTKGTLAPQIKTDAQTSLVILNTIYFKDQWSTKFEKSKTKDDTFTKSDGGKVTASFLNDKRDTGFYKGENFSRSSLTLQNSGEIVFVLPDEGTSPESILKSQETIKNAFEGGKDLSCIVNWKIPKFKFNADYELKNSLQNLGINSAFDNNADFKVMTSDTPTFINNVHQGTYIALNEDGIEASAFTDLFLCGAAAPPPDVQNMYLTRPFLYGIYSENGTLLFIGVVENPT